MSKQGKLFVIEAALVRQCMKGDIKSQQALFDHFADRFYRLGLRYVKDAAEAEDVVMQAFVQIFEGIKKFHYQEPRSFESWMYKIKGHVIANLPARSRFGRGRRSESIYDFKVRMQIASVVPPSQRR